MTQVFAQNRTVTGTVTAKDDGLPIPGVTVKVKGTTIGTQTNAAGKFSLSIPANSTLTFSFIGYVSIDRPVGSSGTLNIVLESSNRQLGEVVVTGALGIKKAARETGYSSTKIGGKDLTQSNVTNVANGLTAKVAGLAVSTIDNSIDPQVRITLRGNRSALGNNTALIVVDGVPIPGGSLSSVNPNDIADINILKGAGAAALYGSEAANGALIITTKRGTGDSKPTITYSNSFQLQQVAYFPKFQNKFGIYGGEGDPYIDPETGFSLYTPYENQQYGPAYDGHMVQVGYPAGGPNGPVLMVPYTAQKKNPIEAFFNNGFIEQNNISFAQGDAKNSFYLSAQNAYSKGVVPGDKNNRTSVSVRGAKTYGKFKADFSVEYTRTDISTYGTGYNGSLLFTNLIQWPSFLNIKDFKDSNNGTFANPSDFYDAYAINPYWITDNSRINKQRDVFLSNLRLSYQVNNWMDLNYTVSQNFGIDQEKYTRRQVNFTPYSISDPLGAGSVQSTFKTGVAPGIVSDYYQYGDGTSNFGDADGFARLQGDATINLHKTFFKDFKTSLLLGNTIRQQYRKGQSTGSNNLLIKDFYNINTIGGVVNASEAETKIRQVAYFGALNIGYKDYLFLEGTLRNERDSRLNAKNRSFYYPSGKISFIPTDAFEFLKNNKVLSYAKVYGSVSRVGNISIGAYRLQNTYGVTSGFPYGSLGALTASTINYSPNLKPESINEIEVGTELSFFDGRISAKATYYKQNSKNQTLQISTSAATGYSAALINAGEIQSTGTEFELIGDILTKSKNKVGLRLGGNLSINDSKVLSLLPGINSLQIGNNVYAQVGQPFPIYKGTDLVKDPQGRTVVDAVTGLPSVDPTQKNFGRTTPKYILGVNAQVSYDIVTLSGVGEYRGGYIIYNGVGSTLNFGGSSYLSAAAGRQRFIYPNSVIQTSPGVYTPNTSVSIADGNYGFWQSSAYNTANGPRVTSAAFWKIREIALAFDLTKFIRTTGFVKGLSFALTGRNLALWTPKSNTYGDPEFSNSVGNDAGTNSASQTPATRVYGADLHVTF
ncbi:TonB-linked SusC/RagA family outer membrane protein [Mucilaginibacter sp. SG538B]|uniref:SusC/RagA family TonB-linked outer membrane protein n=1 Tax=Mucilaginibacter sp. SG538B TaxID=2587021 RepID=UPI00159D53F8|nr:SusC/RagA family TonB-linked outer membrane protein [Mucilaginibacter sp. SG538B]NVM64311.1 TonB-linked SusC/RagA family outer membrane protein [Mucilaginibacter sp. SG538B]